MSDVPLIPRRWSDVDISGVEGKKFFITGGTSGLGKESAAALVRRGALVTITARTAEKGAALVAELGGKNINYSLLDLTDLDSVKACASSVKGNIDVLILNAGVMATPFLLTKDKFELQMGTNHLGHFALAGLLRKQITTRIVSVASQAHRLGNFGNGTKEEIRAKCLGQGEYKPWSAYGATKLANLLFTHELQRLSIKNDWKIDAMAAHPGWSNTNLQNISPQMREANAEARITSAMNDLFAQSAHRGSLPVLAAATYSPLLGGSYIGPDGFMEMRGYPKLTRGSSLSYDQELASNLWSISEELTGIAWA
jgi:NAD(P)-dependent dehydrogenase (short-subunit alcohol dehydrogenase family)